MNSLQKQYELKSRMFINNNQKTEVTDYFKFIDQIRNRPSRYTTIPENITIKKVIYEPYKDPNVIEANKKYKLKLYTILQEPPLPKLNNVYLEVREKLRNSKEKYREIAERALSVENVKFHDRVFNQKPRVEEVNNYRKIHKILKISKTREYESDVRKFAKKSHNLILPSINGHKEGKSEKIFQTEVISNSDHFENEQSADNSVNLKDHKYNEITHQKQGHING